MVVSDAIGVASLSVREVEVPSRAETPAEDSAGLQVAAELDEALRRHTPVLLAAARALVRDESDARDLVQTTLEIAARKAGDLRDAASLRSWLLAVQTREAFRLRRRLARVIRLNRQIAETQMSSGPDPDVIALRTALAVLRPRARAAVVLHYLAGLPVADVARAMGISENTTKGHLKAGVARLREELRDD
jgi:RNA polymerase sigma-70 factor (ECF subfamily)